MSGALALIADLFGSRAALLPASFRGVPFYMQASAGQGGRRVVTHEFPLRDDAYTEDLGRLPRRFRLTAFVVDNPTYGLSYLDARDALIDAIEGYADAGTLMHPTFGPLTCRASTLSWQERVVGDFGYCSFDIEFVVDNPTPGPLYFADTASLLFAGVASLLPILSSAYTLTVGATEAPVALLESAAAALLALPIATIAGLDDSIAAVSASPTNAATTAAAVQTVLQAVAANVIAANVPADTTMTPVAGAALVIPDAVDVTGGISALTTWGSALPTISIATATGAALAQQQALVVGLVQGNAVAALALIYASYSFPSAQQAAAARAQMLALIDAQALAAANAGSDDLYRAWNALEAQVIADMIGRAQSLPSQAIYALPASLPALALAQLLLTDPTQADALADLNDAAQSLFMPASGLWLQPNG